jgi:indolepyruvate ferredoxin oxidoreductase beta subunit
VTNIKLVGVGGQGILLATELVSEVALRAGHEVKTSEVHGMAQRGGSVFSDIRYGEHIYSPLIPEGQADILVGFEQLETARYLNSLAPGGIAVVNEQIIPPLGVSLGQASCPGDLLDRIRSRAGKLEVFDAAKLARQAGNVRAANTVILGVLSRYLDFPESLWIEVLRDRLGAKLLQVNLAAFALGRQDLESQKN